ncbi:MAG: PP2C family protein-serine/threonine phosphatase [Acidobacteriota bacterium]|nr:PP2C family protein-serine/threonine phosphatase [Acidobacteriota bacterium]
MEFSEALLAQQQVVRMQALLEASRQIHSTIELDEVLTIALKILVRELELTGAFFAEYAHTYGDFPDGLEAFLRADSSNAGVHDCGETWLRIPLLDKSGARLTDLVAFYPATRTLELEETDFLESLAMQAAVAIENAHFHERTVQWQRVESDLAAARLVQMSIVPQTMPQIPGYSLAVRMKTCYEVGGDYLDIVTQPLGDIVMVVGDVAGKGLASALVGMSFRSAFRAMVNAHLPLVDIATRMNRLHYAEGDEARHRYVTAFLIRLSPEADLLEVVNCGHNPAFLVTPGAELIRIKASGTPVGLLPFSNYKSAQYPLAPGARLLVYTDGMTEVFRGQEEFGEARLQEFFEGCQAETPEATLDALNATLETFSSGYNQTDDMSALVLFRDPQSTPAP